MTRFKSFHEVAGAKHPSGIYHEITWFIERELTLDEWAELDDKMSDVLHDIVGDDAYFGIAGPIPLPRSDDAP